jgi:hypothetical protein
MFTRSLGKYLTVNVNNRFTFPHGRNTICSSKNRKEISKVLKRDDKSIIKMFPLASMQENPLKIGQSCERHDLKDSRDFKHAGSSLSVLYIAVTAAGLLLLNGLIKLEVLRADGERETLLRVATRMFLVNLWLWVPMSLQYFRENTDKSNYVKGS